MQRDEKIYVAGHRGMVGSALVRALRDAGHADLLVATSRELDLREQSAVIGFLARERPSKVFLTAGTVGGILANSTRPAEFLYDNVQIATNVIDAAYRCGVGKLLYLGSTCVYPRLAQQPIKESSLLEGPLEPTNEAYAVAKIAGIKLCQAYRRQYGCNFIAAMPTNLYGPGDRYSHDGAHVLAALMRRFHEARLANAPSVEVWGSGTPTREFLHVDDLAGACLFLMARYEDAEIINVGTGKEISIMDLAHFVAGIVGYRGTILLDRSKPDGTPRKVADSSRLRALGWRPRVPFKEGMESTYRWFSAQHAQGLLRE